MACLTQGRWHQILPSTESLVNIYQRLPVPWSLAAIEAFWLRRGMIGLELTVYN